MYDFYFLKNERMRYRPLPVDIANVMMRESSVDCSTNDRDESV